MNWKTTTILTSLLIAASAYSGIRGIPDGSPVRGKWKLIKQTPKKSELMKSKTYKKMSYDSMAAQLKRSGLGDAEIKETIDSMETVGNPGNETTTYDFGKNRIDIQVKSESSSLSTQQLFKISGKEIQIVGPEDTEAMKAILSSAHFAKLQKMVAMKKSMPNNPMFQMMDFMQACMPKSYKVALVDNGKKLLLASGPIAAYDNQSVRYEFVRAE